MCRFVPPNGVASAKDASQWQNGLLLVVSVTSDRGSILAVKFFKKSFFRRVLMIVGILFLFALIGAVTVVYSLSAPGYNGAVSDHFDGKKFINRDPVERPNSLKAMMYFLTAKLGPWRDWTENKAYPPPPSRNKKGDLRVTFINHSTVLIQMDGYNILTDPIWSERCSPFPWAGPKRRRAAGLKLEELPPLDFILLSHNHYDHFDIPTLKRIMAKHNAQIITGLGNAALLNSEGIKGAIEMDWDEELALNGDLILHGLPSRHFSNRSMFDQDLTLWLSFAIRGPAGVIYFAGDSGYGSHFEAARHKFGSFRLALLPIGAYLPRWFMQDIHMSPEEAVQAHIDLNASVSVGIHHGTFQLAAESQDQPVEDLIIALDKIEGPRPEFWVLDFGEGREVPASQPR